MDSDSDLRGRKQTREMEEANEARRRSELEAAQRLQHIATQLIDARGIEALYEQILDTVLAILDSDFASLQMFYPARGSGGELRLLGHRGFSAEVARRWEWVGPTTRSTCGEALRTRQRVAIGDVRNCDFMAGSEDLDGYLGTGIHAAQSTPLISRSGALLGMVSTHWRDPHELSLSELRALDVLARLAADLMECSQGEEALRRSEERFGRVMNSMAEGLYTLDKEGLVTFVNPAAEKMFGWTRAELLGKNMHETIHYKHLDGTPFPASECAGLRVLKTGIELHEDEDFFIRKDGSVFPVIVSSSPIVNGEETAALVVVFRDETERRRAETALRESEERLNSIYNAVSDIIFQLAVEPEGQFRFVSVNAAFLKITGLRPESVVGKTVNEVIPEPSLTVVLGKYRQAVEDKAIVCWEETSDYPTGRLTGEVSIAPVLDDKGRCTGLVGSVHDITERKRAEAAQFERQKLESVGTLASGIAHDFNNLLAGVLAQAELALDELATGSHPEEELKGIRELAVGGSDIVRQLMIYAGKDIEVLGPVDVSGTVEQMVDLLKFSVSKHATLATDLGKDLPTVQTSAGQLRRIVMNLVTNASDAIGDRDGVIRVTTRCVSVGRDWSEVTWTDLAEGDYLQLEVSDSGRGMPMETQARVFDPFFTTKSAGHGLGLAVVHGIVRSLGGAIRIQSEPGEGTTFRILLPCTERRLTTTGGETSFTEEAIRPVRDATVLVVEDEDSVRRAVVKMLRRAGFSIIEASDGFAALQAIRTPKRTIDVLLLDITLPGAPSRDVFEEAKRLRPDMSVIVTSGYSEHVAAEMLHGKIEGFIRKPYRVNQLMDLIRQAPVVSR